MWIDQDSHCQTGQMQGMIMWIDQARVKKMALVEQEMFANLKVMYQTGKGNDHLVPVLVPTDVAPALCLLAQPDNRKAVGVSKDNPFLFPAVHAGSDHCSGGITPCVEWSTWLA